MRSVFAYLILFAFSLQLGSRLYVLINFQVNKEYIAENLCEKKDEPESCCEGSCHLTKELVKIEESEQNAPATNDQSKKEKNEDPPLYNVFSSFYLNGTDQETEFLNSDKLITDSGFISDLLRPPAITS